MSATLKYLVVSALLAVLLLKSSAVAQPAPIESMSLEVGRPFPIILLPRMNDGLPDTIVNYRGQKIIMHIFASW